MPALAVINQLVAIFADLKQRPLIDLGSCHKPAQAITAANDQVAQDPGRISTPGRLKRPIPDTGIGQPARGAINRGISRDLHFDPFNVISPRGHGLELRCLKAQANQGRQRVAQLTVNDLRKAGELKLSKISCTVVNAFLALKPDIPRGSSAQLDAVAAFIGAGAFAVDYRVNLGGI